MKTRVLFAVDFTPDVKRKAQKLAETAWPPGTIVRILSAVESIPPAAAELWFDCDGSLPAVMEARRERCEELVAATAEVLRTKGIEVETAVRFGRMRRVVAREAKAWQANVIVQRPVWRSWF